MLIVALSSSTALRYFSILHIFRNCTWFIRPIAFTVNIFDWPMITIDTSVQFIAIIFANFCRVNAGDSIVITRITLFTSFVRVIMIIILLYDPI